MDIQKLGQQMLGYHASAFEESVNWLIEQVHTSNSLEGMYVPSSQPNSQNGMNIVESARRIASLKTVNEFYGRQANFNSNVGGSSLWIPDFNDDALKPLGHIVDRLVSLKSSGKETKSIRDDFYATFKEAIHNRDPFKLGIGKDTPYVQTNAVLDSLESTLGIPKINAYEHVNNTGINANLVSNQRVESNNIKIDTIMIHDIEKYKKQAKDQIKSETGTDTIISNSKVEGNPLNPGNVALNEHEKQKNATRRLVNAFHSLGRDVTKRLNQGRKLSEKELTNGAVKFTNMALSYQVGDPIKVKFDKQSNDFFIVPITPEANDGEKSLVSTIDRYGKKLHEMSDKTGINIEERTFEIYSQILGTDELPSTNRLAQYKEEFTQRANEKGWDLKGFQFEVVDGRPVLFPKIAVDPMLADEFTKEEYTKYVNDIQQKMIEERAADGSEQLRKLKISVESIDPSKLWFPNDKGKMVPSTFSGSNLKILRDTLEEMQNAATIEEFDEIKKRYDASIEKARKDEYAQDVADAKVRGEEYRKDSEIAQTKYKQLDIPFEQWKEEYTERKLAQRRLPVEINGKMVVDLTDELQDQLTDINSTIYYLNNGNFDEVLDFHPTLHTGELKLVEDLLSREYVDGRQLLDEAFINELNYVNNTNVKEVHNKNEVARNTYFTLNDIAPLNGELDPERVRDAIYNIEQGAKKYKEGSYADLKKYNEIRELLEYRKENNVSLEEILFTGDVSDASNPDAEGHKKAKAYMNFRASSIAELVTANIAFGGSLKDLREAKKAGVDIAAEAINAAKRKTTTDVDKSVRFHIANVLNSSNHMQVRTFIDVRDQQFDDTTKKDHLLAKVKQLSADFGDPSSTRYGNLYRATNIGKQISYLKQTLYDERRDLENQVATYLEEGRDIDSRKELDKRQQEESTRYLRIVDENDKAYARMKEALAENKDSGKGAPKSPMVMFSNSLEQMFLVSNLSSSSKELSKERKEQLVNATVDAEMNLQKAKQFLSENAPVDSNVSRVITDYVEGALPEGLSVDEERHLQSRRADVLHAFRHEKTLQYDQLEKDLKAQEERRRKAQFIVDNNGATDGFTERDIAFAKSVEEKILDGNSEGIEYTAIQEKGANTYRRNLWNNAIETNSTLRIDGSKVGYKAVGMNGSSVVIRPMAVLVDDVKFQLNKLTPVGKDAIVAKMDIKDRRKYSLANSDFPVTDDIQGGFIELKYDNTPISQENLDKLGSPYIKDKLNSIEDGLNQLIPLGDHQTVVVSPRNIEELISGYYKEIGNKGKDISNDTKLPSYLVNMIHSHANFMATDQEIVGNAYIAMIDSINDIAKEGGTIDLTEEGIMNRWVKSQFGPLANVTLDSEAEAGPVWKLSSPEMSSLPADKQLAMQGEVDEFNKSLANRSVVERLQDSMFMDVLRNVHAQHFMSKGRQSADGERDFGFITNKIIEVYKGANPDAKPMSVDTLNAIIHSPEMNEAFDQAPHYKPIRNMSRQELKVSLLDSINDGMGSGLTPEGSLSYLSVEQQDPDGMYKVDATEAYDSERDESNIRVQSESGVESDVDASSEVFRSNEQSNQDASVVRRIVGDIEYEDHDPVYVDSYLDPTSKRVKERLFERNAGERDKSELIEIQGGEYTTDDGKVRYYGLSNFEQALEVHKMDTGEDRLTGTIDLKGNIGSVNAEIFKGGDGEILAYVPQLNEHFQITETMTGLDSDINPDYVTPRFKNDGTFLKADFHKDGTVVYSQKESIGDVGKIKISPLFSPSMQGSGAYKTSSNPSSTVDQMIKFVSGDQKFTYLDIETTGLLGGTIDDKYIQPLEIYAEQIQWDTNKGDLMTNEAGQHTILTSGGNPEHRSMKQYVALRPENVAFAQDILQKEDFMISFNERVSDGETGKYVSVSREFDILDYMGEEALHKEGKLKSRPIHERILQAERMLGKDSSGSILRQVQEKKDKLSYLMNIAKYSMLGETPDPTSMDARYQGMYTGNIPMPSKSIHLENKQTTDGMLQEVAAAQNSFFERLHEDVNKGIANLNVNSGKGVVQLDEMLVSTSKFIERSPVIGQNIVDADIRFLTHSADLLIDNAKEFVESNTTSLSSHHLTFLDELDIVRNDLFEEMKDKIGIGLTDDSGLLHSASSDTKQDFAYFDDWLSHVQEESSMKVTLTSSLDIVDQIQSLEEVMDEIKMGNMPLLSDSQKGLFFEHGLDDRLKDLQSSVHTTTNEVPSQTALINSMEKAKEKIVNRPFVEQGYLMRYLHPELKDQKAESHAGVWDIGKGAQHFAEDDVKTGIQVIRNATRELIEDQSFAEYQDSPEKRNLRKGDFIQMKRSVENNPLGVYRVGQIDYAGNSIELFRADDGTNDAIRISSNDPLEFINKIQNNFEHIGSGGKKKQKEVIEEFNYDQARRQVLRTLNGPFNFDLSEMQVEDTYLPNLKALHGHYATARRKQEKYEADFNKWQSMRNFETEQGRFEVRQGEDGLVERQISRFEVTKDTAGNIVRTETQLLDPSPLPVMPQAPEFSPLEMIALQNKNLLGSDRVYEILNETITPTRQMALEKTGEFMNSEVGQKYQDFFNKLERLEQVGSVSRTQSSQIIKAWNEQIKEAAAHRGAKHELKNNINLGDFVVNYKDSQEVVENLRLDIGSRASIESSLFNMYGRLKRFSTPDNEEERRNLSFKNHIVPMLNRHGLLTNYKPTGGADDVKVDALAKDIFETIKNNPKLELQPFLQDNPLMYAELGKKDETFLQGIDGLQEQLLGNYESSLTDLQKAHWQQLDTKEESLREQGVYIPQMDMKPSASELDGIVLDAINFGRNGGRIDHAPVSELQLYAEAFKKDAELMNKFSTDVIESVYNKLAYDATRNQNISGMIDEIILEKGIDSSQVRSMKALNWVIDNPNFGQGDSRPLIQNPNLSEYILGSGAGSHARYNASTLHDIDLKTLDQISRDDVTEYSGTGHRAFIKDTIEKYQERISTGVESHGGLKAPIQRVLDTDIKAQNEALIEKAKTHERKPVGEGDGNPIDDRLQQMYKQIQQDTEPDGPVAQRPDGLLERWVHDRKESLKEVKNNFVDDFKLNPGGGGRWIAGLGVAAAALAMFHNAGSPIKLEDRPQGQGVAGTNGRVQDDVQFGDDGGKLKGAPPSPSTGGKTYANNGEKGYTVKASGKATSNINQRDLQMQMKNTSGNVNIKMKDERTAYDRGWLEDQFSTYIDRGHLE